VSVIVNTGDVPPSESADPNVHTLVTVIPACVVAKGTPRFPAQDVQMPVSIVRSPAS
jgi:hypothetical protein